MGAVQRRLGRCCRLEPTGGRAEFTAGGVPDRQSPGTGAGGGWLRDETQAISFAGGAVLAVRTPTPVLGCSPPSSALAPSPCPCLLLEQAVFCVIAPSVLSGPPAVTLYRVILASVPLWLLTAVVLEAPGAGVYILGCRDRTPRLLSTASSLFTD